jgi:hypothetical protein
MNPVKRWTRVLVGGCVSLVAAGIAFAQESTSTAVTTTSDTSRVWYTEWWMWGVGIAVFLIVVIALTNRGRTAKE